MLMLHNGHPSIAGNTHMSPLSALTFLKTLMGTFISPQQCLIYKLRLWLIMDIECMSVFEIELHWVTPGNGRRIPTGRFTTDFDPNQLFTKNDFSSPNSVIRVSLKYREAFPSLVASDFLFRIQLISCATIPVRLSLRRASCQGKVAMTPNATPFSPSKVVVFRAVLGVCYVDKRCLLSISWIPPISSGASRDPLMKILWKCQHWEKKKLGKRS